MRKTTTRDGRTEVLEGTPDEIRRYEAAARPPQDDVLRCFHYTAIGGICSCLAGCSCHLPGGPCPRTTLTPPPKGWGTAMTGESLGQVLARLREFPNQERCAIQEYFRANPNATSVSMTCFCSRCATGMTLPQTFTVKGG